MHTTAKRRSGGRATWIAALGLSILGACTNGDGLEAVAGGALTGNGDFLVQDAPANDLLSFTVDVTEVRLVDALGGASANLLDAARRVELLGLQGRARWIDSGGLPAGTWSAVRLAFSTTTAAAVSKAGASVPVTVPAGLLQADFAAPLVIDDSGDYGRVVVDVDLAASLTGDMTALTFLPSGLADVDAGVTTQELDELRGTVLDSNAQALRMTLQAYADDDLLAPLGVIDVTVAGGAELYREDGLAYAAAADFFADLVANATTLEVHGVLTTAGGVTADEVHVDDHDGGASSAGEVEVEGLVASLGAGTFDLLIAEVEKGAAIAGPVIAGLADPTTLTVTHDANTDFFDMDGAAATSADLAVGQRVKARFGTFTASPFPAGRVRLEFEAGAEVVVTSVAGLPGNVTVHVDADEPWVTSGAVASDTTDVTVALAGATVVLDAAGDPVVPAADLEVGLELRVEGALAGTTVSATNVEVHPGRLEGQVTAAPSTTSFVVSISAPPDDPFGANVDGVGPYTLQLAAGAVVAGAAASGTELKQLFDGLLPGETLVVEVRGLGTDVVNEITAYEIDAEVQ